MDKKKIQKAVRMILEAIGENPNRMGLRRTPVRVAQMYSEICSGLKISSHKSLLKVLPAEKNIGIIIVKNIPFYSICEHHLLPFFGRASIAYMPDKKIAGVSKFARLVDVLAAKPQVQERLTREIATFIWKSLEPKGIFVLIEATHLCMTMRGPQKEGSSIVTTSARGVFLKEKYPKVISMIVKGK